MTMISSLRRVGLVNFTIDGDPISVKKGNSLLSDVGEPLSYDDYVILLASDEPQARLAVDLFVESCCHQIGAAAADLKGLDAVNF